VQLVGSDSSNFGQTVPSDSLGEFTFPDVPAGRYTVGFYHPVLDSLGIEAPLRAVRVVNTTLVRADLGVPGPARIRTAVCGAPASATTGALVMGVVRDARSRDALAGVTVSGQWTEISIGKNGMAQRMPRRVATTLANGWYAICDAPSPGTLALSASRGADSTDVVDVEVPSSGFLRRDLYLGAAQTVSRVVSRTIAPLDSAVPVDTAVASMRIHVGDGRLSGRVVSAAGARPLAGVQVGITRGPQTRTNARGEWNLLDAPRGTRMLELRALGHYPMRQVVDVVDSAPVLRTAMVTLKAVLDTVKVLANYQRYSDLAMFRERSRSGLGRFLTAEDIMRRQPIATSEIFRNVPGVYLEPLMGVEETIQMRGTFDARCTPTVYINGGIMEGLAVADLDAFVKPREIAGIEVYRASQAPAQFLPPLSGCGSIVIWTK